ncbi:hypothetical protein [Mangrovimonas xylaniphaga]|uniref:hypothetical protein n=1 Tax=Mangrovimonas xylaniphaga TaxID=1645915 RepID=UPI0006B4D6FE|nr:hypothetical protein [Mangrovimonas xylaniphaga]
MKKIYIFSLVLLTSAVTFGQSLCSDAQPDAVYAYSHVKTAYDSNNLTHLKQYSKRSLEAFERVKTTLENCGGCKTAYNKAYDGAELLAKVASAETFEDGRYYVKKAKEIAQETITELDMCTKGTGTSGNQDLADLESAQFELEQQQLELQRKQEEIKQRLVEQQQKEIAIKKELLISEAGSSITENIKSYNKVLSSCGCQSENINFAENKTELMDKSLEEIRSFYINTMAAITNTYLERLNSCKM